jgi:acetyl-CoA synthetase
MQNVIWTPPAEVVDRARVTAFMREQGIAGWHNLGRRAQDDIGWFWDAVVTHLGLEFTTPYTRVYDDSDGPMWTRWFGGGRINLTHNCVDRHARDNPERTAVIWESEDGQVRTVSYGELEAEVNRIGNALLQLGVEPGQTVGLFLPMSVEVVAGFYAICKIGAIAVPIFSGFGAPAVAARLRDAGAVALLTADAVPRRGKPVSMKEIADAALEQAPSVRHVVVWDRLGTRPAMRSGRDHHWHELVAGLSA